MTAQAPSQTPPAWRALCPFESHFAEIGGQRIHYFDEGVGSPMLMVHGNPTWAFYWRELIKAFRGSHRVVALDHVGCGLSSRPEPGTYPFRLARRIDDLVGLIQRLDLRDVTLVAHDWGGAIGMGAAAAVPDRFRRFVLLNTAAFRSKRFPLRIRVCRTPLLGRLGVQGLNLFARAATRMTVCRPLSSEVRDGLLAPYDTWSRRRAVFEFVRDVPLSPRHPSYATLLNIEQSLPRLADRPVQIIWGMHDWCFPPAFIDRFLDFFPHAVVHRLADAGHYVVEDSPDDVIAAIRQSLSSS